ncbi:unnamed protein product [Caretta caretta]
MTGLVLREPELRLVLSAYADDVLLVVQDPGDLARVEACQAIYSAASSARVNWVKSSGLAVGDWRQETHTDLTAKDSWRLEWADRIYFSHSMVWQAGVATVFFPNLRAVVLGVAEAVPGRLLHLRVHIEGLVVNLVNVYAPTSGPERLQFYQQASAFLSTLGPHKCLVLGGNFNTTLKERDCSATEQSPADVDTLRQIVEHHSLVDIWCDHHPDDTSTFTFVQMEAHQSSHSRLDRIYLSRFHLSRAHSSSIWLVPFSDHHLATVTASLCAERSGPAYWHFNNNLLEDEGFVTSFREFWLAWRGQQRTFPLERRWWDLGKVCARLFCRDYTQGTSRQRNAAIEQLEREVLELERRLAASPEDPLLYRACREKREELRALEDHWARGAFVRSRIHLLWEMDRGSHFFYALEKMRGAKKHITCLLAEDGTPSRNRWRCGGGPEPSTQVFSSRIRPTLALAECFGRSFLCTDYKIVAKAISLQLGSVLADVIHPDQTDTVLDRSIFNNLFMVQDLLELGRRDGLSFALLSRDQEKAFDRVDHGYLLSTLQLNWTLTEPVSFGQGVRQGCPLLGQLYALVIEPFLCLLRRRLTGFVLQKPELQLVLSAYADDMLLVIQDLGDLALVEACQAIYSAASSALVNWVKSSGLAVGDWRQASSLPPVLQTIRWSAGPLLYLDVYLSATHPSVPENWENLEGRVIERLRKWTGLLRYLSLRERALVLNQLLLSMLWYRLNTLVPAPGFLTNL